MGRLGKKPDGHSGTINGGSSFEGQINPSTERTVAQEIGNSVPTIGERDSVALRHHPWLWLLPVVLLLLALGPWPYGYYTLLRLIVCGVCVILAWQQWQIEDGASAWVVTMGGIAVLYNPIFPIHLTREIWLALNPLAAVVLVTHLMAMRRLTGHINRKLERQEPTRVKIGRSVNEEGRNAVSRPDSEDAED